MQPNTAKAVANAGAGTTMLAKQHYGSATRHESGLSRSARPSVIMIASIAIRLRLRGLPWMGQKAIAAYLALGIRPTA